MPEPTGRPRAEAAAMTPLHGGHHVGVLHLPQEAEGPGQVVGAEDHRVEAGHSDDLVDRLHAPRRARS